MALTLDGAVLVPVADPVDGEATGEQLTDYVGPNGRVIVVHVIEKSGGIDEAPAAQREEYAAEIFDAARRPLEDAGIAVETDLLSGDDIVETIFDAAADRRVDAVAFHPRESNRFVELLTGDLARALIKDASVPVVALPQAD